MSLAYWLSPQEAGTCSRHMQSKNLLHQKQLDTLCSLLSTLLSTEPSSINDLATSLRLEREIAESKLEQANTRLLTAQMANLPHRTYIPTLKHDGVEWVAIAEFYEGIKLVGRGDCPQAALADFDNQWLGIK